MAAGRLEQIPNRPLSGDELRKLIAADTERLLSNISLLSPHMGYGRVGYEIIIRLHVDNASHPTDTSYIQSKPGTTPAVEAPPLEKPSAKAAAKAHRATRSVFSPNNERIRAGLPITATHRDQDGSTVYSEIKYPPDPEREDTFKREDAPAEAEMAADWKLDPSAKQPEEVEP